VATHGCSYPCALPQDARACMHTQMQKDVLVQASKQASKQAGWVVSGTQKPCVRRALRYPCAV